MDEAATQSLRERLEKGDLTHVKLGITDIDGVMRGKYVAAADIIAGLQDGLTFCDCIVGWDCDDLLYTGDDRAITGWHTGYPDTPIRLDAVSARTLPKEFGGEGLLVLGELDGDAAAICPRALLRRIIDRAHAMGFEPLVGFEYEFALFRETRESVRAKNFQGLQPVTPGNFGYSVLRSASMSTMCEELLASCAAMDVPLAALHTENGPGIWEAAIRATDPLAAADRAAVFKTFAKAFAQDRGLIATFMAKWSGEHQGQGGHMHISLRKLDGGEPLFFDAEQASSMSTAMRHAIGGQLALLPELAAMVAPTVNAYTRLTPGAWAPTAATWGLDNRTCALRVIGRAPTAKRIEFRVAGADANPYLALAAALASALHGIEHGIEPPPPVTGNAYAHAVAQAARLPATLGEAAGRFRGSATARTLFGEPFVEHFARTRQWEEAQFRAAVTDWELRRYLEII